MGIFKKCVAASVMAMLIITGFVDVEGRNSTTQTDVNKLKSDSSLENEENLLEQSLYPFHKMQSIDAEDTSGIIAIGNKIILLGTNYGWAESSEGTKNGDGEFDFSDLNFFKKYPNLINIEIRDKQLTLEMLENLQKFMPRELVGLIFNKCYADKESANLFEDMIRKRDTLKSISFIYPDCPQEITDAVVNAVASCQNLQHLNLNFGHISQENCKNIAKAIKDSAKSLRGLSIGFEEIDSDDNGSGLMEIGEAIKAATDLEQLSITILDLPEAYSKEFFACIPQLKYLKDLKLYFGNLTSYNNVIAFECIELLLSILEYSSTLEHFDISGMQLPDKTMQLIAQTIAKFTNLSTLNLSQNTIGEDAARELSNSFKNLEYLQNLFMNFCELTPSTFGTLCQGFAAGSDIQTLWLRGNAIGNGARNLPFSNLPKLNCVDFSKNEIVYDDAKGTIEAAKGHPTLRIMNFSDNKEIDERSTAQKTIDHDNLVTWKVKNNCHIEVLGI